MVRPLSVLTAAALLVVVVGCTSDPPRPEPADGLRLSMPRAAHNATLLADGRVLITGGCTQPGCGGFEEARRSEVYDPGRGMLRGPLMATARTSGTATLLEDGRVLLVGGYTAEGVPPTASAEVFDPESDDFDPVGDLRTPRADHTASLLPDGSVIVAGGFGPDGAALAGTEVFDPASETFKPGPDLSAPRATQEAVTIGDRVVLVGGRVEDAALGSTDVLRDGVWSPGPGLRTPRVKCGATATEDGRVLVVGGASDAESRDRFTSTELLDVARGVTTAGPSLGEGAYKLTVAALPDGRIVVPAGDGLEVLDPRTRRVTVLPGTTYDGDATGSITAVGDDAVLVAGGYDDQIVPTDRAVLVTIPAPEAATG